MRSITVRILQTDEWALYRDIRLNALQDAPDAFSGTYAVEATRPSEQWQSRLQAAGASNRDLALIAIDRDGAVGLCWAKANKNIPPVVSLYQMWVHPRVRGQGIGAELLQKSIDWSKSLGAQAIELGVTQANSPAYRLYERAGFKAFGALEPLREGSSLFSQNMVLDLEDNKTLF